MRILTRYVLFDLLKVFLLTLTGLTLLIFIVLIGKEAVDSAWRLSRGRAGLMAAVLRDNNDHTLKQAVDQAKDFLRMDSFNRLIFLDKLAADKAQLAVFIDALDRVYGALLDAGAQKRQKSQMIKLTNARRRLNDALASLEQNVSARLIALDLALSLSL